MSVRTAIRVDRNVAMPMRDGTLLRADIWRPEDAGGPLPAILRRTPYGKDTSPPNSDWFRITTAVEAGYVCIVQDTRGRYNSDGEWAAIMWEQEGLDSYDTVEWIAAQDWCDGQVGMCGGSYLGIVQWLAAAENPPHLRAIAPAIAANANLSHLESGGAVVLNQGFSWLAFMTLEWLTVRQIAGDQVDPAAYARVVAAALDPTSALETLPLIDIDALSFDGAPCTIEELLGDAIDRGASFDYDDIEVPTLSIGGWYDIFARTTVEGFQQLDAKRRKGPHHLIMGPWVHASHLPSEQGDLNFGVSAEGAYADLTGKHLAFFDRHLRGSDTELPAVQYFVTGANQWRTSPTWPPAGARDEEWFLVAEDSSDAAAGSGRLEPSAPTEAAGPSAFAYDPHDPVPSHGGRACLGRIVTGPRDQSHIERRDDVLCFTSAPLTTPVEMSGPVTVTLWIESSAPDTDFVARLTDVHPDGRSILHADGILRTRHRRGPNEAVKLTPGEVEEIVIDLGHVAHRLETGHCLRLDITSSDFPRFDRNMNTGNPPGTDAKGEIAHQLIHHAADRPSRVLLTVADDP